MTKIKLCGLSRLEDIEAANRLKPDYVGFVFWPESRRAVTLAQAAALKAALDPSIRAVGVFVDEDPENVAQLLAAGIIDLAQLHGREGPGYLRILSSLVGHRTIQAVKVKGPEDLDRARESRADHLLLDAGAGEGRPFDWSLLSVFSRPYFLAGGLTPDNVGEAIRILAPWGVDVSSGVETDGRKDPAKMEAFVAAVRCADQKESNSPKAVGSDHTKSPVEI